MSTSAPPSIPPLQVFSQLRSQVLRCAYPALTQEALQRLTEYLQTQSCNMAEVEGLKNWYAQHHKEHKGGDGDADGAQPSRIDFAALERAAAKRAGTMQVALERHKEKSNILLSTAASSSASVRAGGGAENSRGTTTTVVSWWQLGGSNPWDFALTADSRGAGADACAGGNYSFCCLKESVDLIEPFLSMMRCAAALGAEEEVGTAYMDGLSYLTSTCARSDPASIFAALELARAFVTLSFAERGGVAAAAKAVQTCHAWSDLRRAAELLEQVDTRENDKQDSHQPTLSAADAGAGTQTKVQAYWSLTLSYSVFFHTVAAYVDGVSGHFERLATAVLGEGGQPDLYLWGASRWSFLSFRTAEANTAARRTAAAAGTGGGSGAEAPAIVSTRLAVLFPSSNAHVTSSGADYYLAEYKPLVTTVITTAAAFSTLLLLSAVATLPLEVVTQRLPLWEELHELYESSDELVDLLNSLATGELGAVWLSAHAAATTHLSHSPHLSTAVMQKLLQAVKQALCYHYMKTRDVTHLAQAAADLCLDSTEDFVEVVTALIRDQYIDARIDLVHETVQLQHTATLRGGAESISEAVARSVLNLSNLEMQLTCMGAERNLVFVPTPQDD